MAHRGVLMKEELPTYTASRPAGSVSRPRVGRAAEYPTHNRRRPTSAVRSGEKQPPASRGKRHERGMAKRSRYGMNELGKWSEVERGSCTLLSYCFLHNKEPKTQEKQHVLNGRITQAKEAIFGADHCPRADGRFQGRKQVWGAGT